MELSARLKSPFLIAMFFTLHLLNPFHLKVIANIDREDQRDTSRRLDHENGLLGTSGIVGVLCQCSSPMFLPGTVRTCQLSTRLKTCPPKIKDAVDLYTVQLLSHTTY